MYKIKDIPGTILLILAAFVIMSPVIVIISNQYFGFPSRNLVIIYLIIFLIIILSFSKERNCQHNWIYFDGTGNLSQDFDPYRCCSKCYKLEIDLSMVSYSITKAADFAYSPSASVANIRKEIIRKVKIIKWHLVTAML